MRTKSELYQAALRTVAVRRQTARALAQDARAQAEAAIPGLLHAEEEVRVRGVRCALAGATGTGRAEAAAALADAKKKLQQLLAEIFDKEQTFTQTEDTNKCAYCDFKAICKR